jgi:hypothetical protein
LGGLRQQRDGHPDQAVKAKLLQHSRVQHGGGRRGRAVPQRRPGVKGPKRHQNAEAEEQERKDQVLGGQERGCAASCERARDIEGTAARLQVKRDQTDQRHERAQAQVERDLNVA